MMLSAWTDHMDGSDHPLASDDAYNLIICGLWVSGKSMIKLESKSGKNNIYRVL